MNFFKKSITFLVALVFMPSLKAAVEDSSYGVKIGSAIFFAYPDNKKQREKAEKKSMKASLWNSALGAALYMWYVCNDHIELGIELLYSRFGSVFYYDFDKYGQYIADKLRQCRIVRLYGIGQMVEYNKIVTCIDTVGFPLLLAWRWTACIRPDFKSDYFLGRVFMGVNPFYCVVCTETWMHEITGAIINQDINFRKDASRLKIGLIGGTSLEFPNGLLLEIKGIAPYNLFSEQDKEWRLSVRSFHFSVGYNFVKLVI